LKHWWLNAAFASLSEYRSTQATGLPLAQLARGPTCWHLVPFTPLSASEPSASAGTAPFSFAGLAQTDSELHQPIRLR